jgi:hypothetical protein
MTSLRFALFFAAISLSPWPAQAWGPAGHRIVGVLAEKQLTPGAQAEVKRLLAGEPEPSLAGVSNWADELRGSDPEQAKKTGRWHYVNFPHDDCVYTPARDCPNGDCVIGAINRNFMALADRKRSDAERRDALKFLVHFVGDIHQPLHAGYADDRGGNNFQINYQGKGTNLHSVWDSLIVESRGLDATAYAEAMFEPVPTTVDPTQRFDRSASRWAVESCRSVQEGGLYPPTPTIETDYLLAQRPLAEQRLRQSGVRLADMINRALAPAQLK